MHCVAWYNSSDPLVPHMLTFNTASALWEETPVSSPCSAVLH